MPDDDSSAITPKKPNKRKINKEVDEHEHPVTPSHGSVVEPVTSDDNDSDDDISISSSDETDQDKSASQVGDTDDKASDEAEPDTNDMPTTQEDDPHSE